MCQLFWGLFLLLMGASIIFNIIFGINVPVFKLFLAGFLIYMGVRVLMPSSISQNWSWSCYSNSDEACIFEKFSSDGNYYKLCLGKRTFDFNSLKDLTEPKTVRIDVQFAEATVLLPANIPVRVKADVTFSTVHFPGKPLNSEYVNLHGAEEPLLTVLIESAFATVVVKE